MALVILLENIIAALDNPIFVACILIDLRRKTIFRGHIPRSPLCRHGLTLIPALLNNQMAGKVQDGITNPFPTSTTVLLEFGNRWVIIRPTFYNQCNTGIEVYPCSWKGPLVSILSSPWIICSSCLWVSGPLFTKRSDVLPQDLVKSRSREIRV